MGGFVRERCERQAGRSAIIRIMFVRTPHTHTYRYTLTYTLTHTQSGYTHLLNLDGSQCDEPLSHVLPPQHHRLRPAVASCVLHACKQGFNAPTKTAPKRVCMHARCTQDSAQKGLRARTVHASVHMCACTHMHLPAHLRMRL